MGKRLWLALWTVFVLLGHLLFDAHTLYQEALSQQAGAYRLSDRRLTDRVVLVVLDSWAYRTLADERFMPKLFAREQSGAHGVLWAPRQTATIHGILSLSTGRSPSGLAAIGLMSSSRFEGWTIFDDVVARGENVSFHGGPAWLPLFGDRGKGHFRETGHGPNFRDEDMEGLDHSRQALLSDSPPALSVVHITETDVAAHQYGTERPEYAAVLKFWDDALDAYLQQVLAKPGTTVIITADHGNDLNGSHGGSESIYRRVPVVLLGQGIAKASNIEMNAADMPATMAVLLGTRAPSGAVALPAAQALSLSTVERGRVVLTAYFHSLMNRAALKERPELLAKARSVLPEHLRDEAGVSKLSEPEVLATLPGVMLTFREREERVGLVRMINGVDWAFVAATFVLAVLLLWTVSPATVGVRPPNWSGLIAMVIVLSLIELFFGVRVAFADAIKGMLHGEGRRTLLMLAGGLGALALTGAVVGWRQRARLQGLVHKQRFLVLVLAYLLTSVLYPVNTMGLMAAMLLAAWLWHSPISPKARWRVMWVGLLALLLSTKVWTVLGESVPPRMAAGVLLALGASGALVWVGRRAGRAMAWWPAGMGLAMLLLPFSCFNLLDLSTQAQLIVASVVVLSLAGWVFRASAGDVWLVLPLAPTLWFWWWGASMPWGLYGALLLGLGLALVSTRKAPPAARHVRLLVAMVCLLLTMSAPLHVPSLMGFMLVVLTFFQWRPQASQRWAAVGMAAVLLVAARYGLFDFYGYADSPLQVYALKHLDLAAAYLGDDTRSIVGAVLMVLLKIWLAGAVLMLAAALFPHWRQCLDDVMTVAAVFLLIQVAQSAMRASLAFDDRSHQYDFAAFSILVHTGLLIFSMLAYGPMRRMGFMQPRQSAQFHDEVASVTAS